MIEFKIIQELKPNTEISNKPLTTTEFYKTLNDMNVNKNIILNCFHRNQ